MNDKIKRNLGELSRRMILTKVLNDYYDTEIRIEGNKVYVLGLMLEIQEAEDIVKEISND